MNTITIIGCGDIGKRVAEQYQQQATVINGLVRSKLSAASLKELEISPIQADLDDANSLNAIAYKNSTVFYLAPPPAKGIEDSRMRNWLASINSDNLPAKIILLGTTAVYGDTGGDWINEESLTVPSTDRGLRRLDAEQQLTLWAKSQTVATVILRVPGIYGPNRLPRKRLEENQPVLNKAECGYTNRIHADDLAMICVAAAERGKNAEIYNVSDGQPSTMTDWFNEVADFLKLPRPPQISMQQAEQVMSFGMLSYLKESRRIDNSKMINDLEITLQYETIKQGIPASV